MEKKNLCGLTAEEIFGIIIQGGYEFRHAVTIAHLIYKKRTADFSKFNRLPKKLLEFIDRNTATIISEPVASEVSADRSVKYLFRNRSGIQYETVYIPDGKRNTVCVSTQSGCRMGCPFCMTAKYGFHGNLAAGDILTQILGLPHAGNVTHIVFMGMGEPLDNIESVLQACRIMTAEWGMAVSPRNITISTVGIAQGVRRFLDESGCNLTLSLYSPFDEERARVIPAERKHPVSEILEIIRNYPVRKRRRLSIAYVMIREVNDTDRHLAGLIKLLKDTGIRVNLLPYHPVKDDPLSSSPEERIMVFKHNLVMSGISASVRKSRGADISAACGLLATGLKQEEEENDHH
jgi:23S rRNA (adenine2503-C2)-methyltransferase